MMKIKLFPLAFLGLLLTLSCSEVRATPYASGVTNANGTVSFFLNEAADKVTVVIGSNTTNLLGALPAGRHSFPLNGGTTFKIIVEDNAAAGYIEGSALQISEDSTLLRFNSPQGIAVNTDPASPYFGRVYIANGAVGTAGGRSVGDGLYVLNPDLSDPLGTGDAAQTGGLDWSKSGSSPYRLTIGEDNNLYIADWSDANGSVYVADPNVSPTSGQNVLPGPVGATAPVGLDRFHGSIASAIVEGSLATGDLTVYVIDEDLQEDREATGLNQLNSLWRHDIGGTLPAPTNMPAFISNQGINFASQVMDLDRGTNGFFYVSNYRSAGSQAGLFVRAEDGSALWDSLTASREALADPAATDILKATGGISISPDNNWIASINRENNVVRVAPLLEGLPDLVNVKTITVYTNLAAQGRDLAFDAAGNIYAISSSAQLLRVISPGGKSIATTTSDGQFTVERPQPEVFVSVTVTDDAAQETGGDNAVFTLTREGATTAALTVNISLAGTATNGVDYQLIPATVTFPAGQAEVAVTVQPLDDAIAETTETIELSLVGGDGYSLRAPATASAGLSDTETPSIEIRLTEGTVYERTSADVGQFTITRLGNTNVEVSVVIASVGAAESGTDFEAIVSPLIIPAGVVSIDLVIVPTDDDLVEEPDIVTIELRPGAGYTVAASSSASLTIRDDDLPPSPILFSETFDTPPLTGWIVKAAAANEIEDYTASVDDYGAAFGLPVAPNSTNESTVGLYLTANKAEATALGAAAVNLYPEGQSFSGDYALRFDLMLRTGSRSTTEHVLFGINHSGNATNWYRQNTSTVPNPPLGGDGLWFAVVADASDLIDYGLFTSTNPSSPPVLVAERAASTLTQVLPNPPYSYAGSPASAAASSTPTWAEVEVSQVGDLITLKINNAVILTYTNTTPYKSGNIMVGYNDQYDSVGNGDALIDNVRVVRLEATIPPQPNISKIEVAGANLVIHFTAPGASGTQLQLQSTPTLVPAVWTDVTSTIESTGVDTFKATLPRPADTQFYRLKR